MSQSKQYVGLDVSLKETSICVIDGQQGAIASPRRNSRHKTEPALLSKRRRHPRPASRRSEPARAISSRCRRFLPPGSSASPRPLERPGCVPASCEGGVVGGLGGTAPGACWLCGRLGDPCQGIRLSACSVSRREERQAPRIERHPTARKASPGCDRRIACTEMVAHADRRRPRREETHQDHEGKIQ
jgi:hypothetical protein